MLRIGLTGGIGSGKSTVAATLASRGCLVVDADQLAREVVEPGMPALLAIGDRFGADLIGPDGALDRPALARLVFADPRALRDLEAVTHPAIWARTAELMAAAGEDMIVVHDMPLLVEKDMAAEYHLVVVVHAEVETRVRRLVESRGIPEPDARARIAAQAGEAARRAAADVILVNDGSEDDLRRDVRSLWRDRLVPFEHNVRHGIASRRPDHLALSDHTDQWPDIANRLGARIRHALAAHDVLVDHVGSTAVPGLVAKPVIDLQVGVPSMEAADDPEWVKAMADAGFPRAPGDWADNAKDGTRWQKRFHGSSDPARVAHIHVREVGSPGWTWALMFRDWMRADPAAREEYAALKLSLLHRGLTTAVYTDAKEPWFDAVDARVRTWAEHTGWHPGG
jgi:dephospho-CoA kinase